MLFLLFGAAIYLSPHTLNQSVISKAMLSQCNRKIKYAVNLDICVVELFECACLFEYYVYHACDAWFNFCVQLFAACKHTKCDRPTKCFCLYKCKLSECPHTFCSLIVILFQWMNIIINCVKRNQRPVFVCVYYLVIVLLFKHNFILFMSINSDVDNN